MFYEVNLISDYGEVYKCYIKCSDLNKAKKIYKSVLSTLFDYDIRYVDISDFIGACVCYLELSCYDKIEDDTKVIDSSIPFLIDCEILDNHILNLW